VFYGLRHIEPWFFPQLEAVLKESGHPIPIDSQPRAVLALQLLGQDDPCLQRQAEVAEKVPGATLQPPRKIAITDQPPIYPGAEKAVGEEGHVVVEFTVLEDGGVILGKRTPNSKGGPMASSALGSLSLLRYEPTRIGTCPVPTIMTYTVNFRSR
jgi:hypothetical protein